MYRLVSTVAFESMTMQKKKVGEVPLVILNLLRFDDSCCTSRLSCAFRVRKYSNLCSWSWRQTKKAHMAETLYEVLGLQSSQPHTAQQITAAFTDRIKCYHALYNGVTKKGTTGELPTQGHKQYIDELVRAFRILSSAKCRGIYDSYGYDGLHARLSIHDACELFQHEVIESALQKCTDIECTVTVVFEGNALLANIQNTLPIRRLMTCPDCKGCGANNNCDSAIFVCAECNGDSFKLNYSQKDDRTIKESTTLCTGCFGTGTTILQNAACHRCASAGIIVQDKRVQCSLADSRCGLLVPDEGNKQPGLLSGNLNINVNTSQF